MSLTGFAKIFDVHNEEYGYNPIAFKPVPGGKTINLYVPKLMGSLCGIGPDKIPPNGLYANATECMPVYAKVVNRIGTFSPTVKENCNWLDKLDSKGFVPKNSTFIVEFLNGNVATPVATTK